MKYFTKTFLIGLFVLLAEMLIAQPTLTFQRCYGGTGQEDAYKMIDRNGNGFVVFGETKSNDGDVSGNHGGKDIWIFRNDNSGSILWQKCFGGSLDETFTDVFPTSDGGYMILGHTYSNDGNVTGNMGGTDIWVFKIDSLGNMLWQNCFGGSSNEYLYKAYISNNSICTLLGRTDSNDGDIVGSNGNRDIWIFKIDNLGNLIWQNCIGGTYNEPGTSLMEFYSHYNVPNKEITFYFTSTSSAIQSIPSMGDQDLWIGTLDSLNNISLQNTLSTSGYDELLDVYDLSGNYTPVYLTDYQLNINGVIYPLEVWNTGSYDRTHEGGYIVSWLDYGANAYFSLKYSNTGAYQGDFGYDANNQCNMLIGGNAYTYPVIEGFIVHSEHEFYGCASGPPAAYTTTALYTNAGIAIGGCTTEDLFVNGWPSGNPITSGTCPTGTYGQYQPLDTALEGGLILFTNASNYNIYIEKSTFSHALQWTKVLGGTGGDGYASYVQRPDTSYWILGTTNSNNGDVSGNHGDSDIWLTQLKYCGNPALASSTPTICTGGTATITLNATAGTSNYTWQQSTNGGSTWTTVSGTNNATTSIVATLTANRLFRVLYNTTSCGQLSTPIYTLTVVPDPTVTLSATNNNFCAGGNSSLTATLNGGVGTGSYQWQQHIGSVWTNIAGATNATYTTPTLSASTNYKVISSQTGQGCGVTGTNTINITVLPLPNIYTNPASASICTGGSSTINAYNGTSYSWSPPTGLSATMGTPVVASPTATTTYSLTGTGTNGCTKTITVPVTVSLDPSVNITGDTTVCSGGSLTLTSNTGGGAGTCTRQWQSSANGSTWSNIAGATATTYTTPALTSTTYYRITYSCSGSGCSPAAISNAHKIHIFNNVLSVVGSPSLCVGGTVKLLAPVMGGSYQCTWTWQNSPNGTTWTTIPNATMTFYYPPTNTAGNTYYRANTNCVGAVCTNTPTSGMLISVIADPSVTITGQNSICGSGSTVLTANPLGGTGTSSYQWQENISGVFTNIAGATGLTYTSPVLTAAKTYRVSHAATGAGCGTANSSNYSISILLLPSIYTSPASASFCIGGTSTITAYNGTSYSWSPATGLSATTGSPVVASPTASTIYSLTGVGTNGCSKTISVSVTVTADPSVSISGPSTVPTGTSATLNSNTTGGSGTCTRQWQSSTNGSTWMNVAGATSATYTTPAIVGTKYYRATYTCSASGCSPAGTSNVLSIMGIQPPVRLGEKVYSLTLYPNPASVGLTVSLLASEDEKATFTMSDMLGKALMQWEGILEDGVYEQGVSIEGLSQGVYFLSVRIGERIMTEKFVKE